MDSSITSRITHQIKLLHIQALIRLAVYLCGFCFVRPVPENAEIRSSSTRGCLLMFFFVAMRNNSLTLSLVIAPNPDS